MLRSLSDLAQVPIRTSYIYTHMSVCVYVYTQEQKIVHIEIPGLSIANSPYLGQLPRPFKLWN